MPNSFENKLSKLLVSFSLVLLISIQAQSRDIELFLWQPTPEHAMFVLPKHPNQSRKDAVIQYLRGIRGNPSLHTFEIKSSGFQKFFDLPKKDFQARVLLLANSKKDHGPKGTRILNYIETYQGNSAIPITLPVAARIGLHENQRQAFLDALIKEFDGINALGGADIAPKHYGEQVDGARRFIADRDAYEIEVIQEFSKDRNPRFITGQCRGCQITVVSLGGTLIQHIPDEIEFDIGHRMGNHGIELTDIADNELREIYQEIGRIVVNTYHHQAADPKDLPDQLKITAISDDGVIEGLAFKNGRGSLVQFHSELLPDLVKQRYFRYYTKKMRQVSSIYTCERTFN